MAAPAAVRGVTLPAGEAVPALGQGSWHLAEDPRRRPEEIAALRLGLDLGMTLIDTAEMYGAGAAEALVGEAIADRREDVFLVGKVLPYHADPQAAVRACHDSLRRLGTDRIDLYLLHWRGDVPLAETLQAFERLVRYGDIRFWGVSNFDVTDLTELTMLPRGDDLATDQVLYNLARRGIEFDLLPRCRAMGIPVMAYAPIEQGRMLRHPILRTVATAHEATPAQVALAWLLRNPDVIVIPKAGTPAHVRENHAALDLELTPHDLTVLDRAFPPPAGPRELEML
jgi:diketogulonate reductase-like aldo/keto reductase